jgi:hypothetical protein
MKAPPKPAPKPLKQPTIEQAIALAHRHRLSRMEVRPDGGFTLEFQPNAHLEHQGGKEVGAGLTAEEAPKKIDPITGLSLSEAEMFGAGG